MNEKNGGRRAFYVYLTIAYWKSKHPRYSEKSQFDRMVTKNKLTVFIVLKQQGTLTVNVRIEPANANVISAL